MSDVAHKEYVKLINEIAEPEGAGFSLKRAFNKVSSLTKISARRLQRLYNREVRLLAEDIIILQSAAQAVRDRRNAESAHVLAVATYKSQGECSARDRSDPQQIATVLQAAADGLAAAGQEEAADRIRREIRALGSTGSRDVQVGAVLGRAPGSVAPGGRA